MTREEAIKMLNRLLLYCDECPHGDCEKCVEAINMAEDALEQEQIIYCKDCKHWHEWENGAGSCHRSDIMWVGSDYYDYCSFAKRRVEQ